MASHAITDFSRASEEKRKKGKGQIEQEASFREKELVAVSQRKGTNVPEREKHDPVYIVLQNPY